MLQTSFLLQKLRREVIPKILAIGLWFLHSAFPLKALSESSFIKLPSKLLEICSGQKCDGPTDGQMDGRTDGRTDGLTKRRLYVLPSGSIKSF